MFLRVAASIILCASITLNAFPGIFRKGDFRPATFDSYELTLADGANVNFSLAGGRAVFYCDDDREFEITLSKCKTLKTVRTYTRGGTSFDVDFASDMNEDELYYVTLNYEAFGRRIDNGNNIIYKSGDSLYFWKSPNYEYNVQSCEEMWTDEQSLMECLQPQNDIECDDPVLIGYSDQICKGASNDWEKVYDIYVFIAHEMAYDNIEAGGASGAYQDSAVDILRDGKGICEGFGNCFAALCRAQEIPAVVEFGIGMGSYEDMVGFTPSPDDYADHAWAAVYLGDRWYFVDPTYDMSRYYNDDGDVDVYEDTTLYYLLPLESFSNDHRITDADTTHCQPSAGHCGDYCTYELTRDGTIIISGYGRLDLPDEVNCFNRVVFTEDSAIDCIAYDCFVDCDLLTSIVLPDTVTRIEDYAFNTCEDLEYVYIPEGCEYIGLQAFCYCDELSYVYIPDSVVTIGEWAFDDCARLYISVPSQWQYIAADYDTQPFHIEVR